MQTENENIPLEIGPKMIVHKTSSGPEAVSRRCSVKKGVLRNFAGLSLQLC